MSNENVYNQLNEKAKIILDKVRSEINKDEILTNLDREFDVEELLTFNEFNIKQRTEDNSFYQLKFRQLFLTETAKLERLKERLNRETGEKYQALKNGEVQLTKTEIEKFYLVADRDLIRIKGGIAKQEMRVKFFELVVKSFESQQWNIKAWHELSKGGY